MAKDNSCEICGGSDMQLVDGFYYCMECGTQDKTTQETMLDVRALADGSFTVATKHKIRTKVKEGVEMSSEWYKWHTYNFVLAGLADELVAHGAEPGFKMKLLWVWSRYIKMYQKKDEMGKSHILSQLESSESEASDAAAGAAAPDSTVPIHRPSRLLLLALLQLALNLQRSRRQPSDLLRLVKFRLLGVNEIHKFVPEEIDLKKVKGFSSFRSSVIQCHHLPRYAARLVTKLRLGPPLTPELEALVGARLHELRLPRALRRLVWALMVRAPAPFRCTRTVAAPGERLPDHEGVVMAYIVVALKLCFGLDDEREARLSAVAEAINEREDRRRAYTDTDDGDVGGGGDRRLFSFRAWCVHMQFREQALCARYAPLAWERGRLADDYAFIEHFEGFDAHPSATRRARRRRRDAALGDAVTMEVLARLPRAPPPAVLPPAAAAARLGSVAPLAALAAELAPLLPPAARRRLREDFTRYDLDYAFRGLELRDDAGRDHVAGGVQEAGKTFRENLGSDLLVEKDDQTVVHVRNCENKNWVKTEARIVTAAADEGLDDGEPPDDAPAPEPETFDEEERGRNVFDDDFMDVKEEIASEDAVENVDDAKDDIEPIAPHEPSGGDERAADGGFFGGDFFGGDFFDSDDEAHEFDPATFDRRETIRNIMVEAYREHGVYLPLKFRTERIDKTKSKREPTKPKRTGVDRAPAPTRSRASIAAVDRLLEHWRAAQARDPLVRAAETLRRAVRDAERAPPEPEPDADKSGADAESVAESGSRVELVENDLNENDSDSSDGAADDPVPKGDARFDATTHDARRLFVRLDDPAADDDDDALDDALGRLLDEKIEKGAARPKPERRRTKKQEKFHRNLVDDPKNVPEFNYWFKRYDVSRFTLARTCVSLEREMDESFPRSFRLVLRWCAGAAALPPAQVYRHVMNIEQRMLALCKRPPPPIRPRNDHPPKKRKRERKSRVPDANTDTESRTPAKRKKKERERSPQAEHPDDASETRDDERDRSDITTENVITSEDEAAASHAARRSRRRRGRSLADPFWR